ncbi:MAG TPA: PAS domain-containing protein [Beijerinckiaceae bacterium]|jgi:hypothetical protein
MPALRDGMKHATTRMIFAYWDALRGERSAPDRGEIEPGEIRNVLADTFLLEVAPERTAMIRLAGTRICAFFGRELRGEAFEGLWREEAAEDVRRSIDIVVEEAAGCVAGLTAETAEGAALGFEMILLPLRHRGKPQTRILGALSPAVIPPWLGLHPVASLTTSSLRVLWPSGRASRLVRGDHDGSAAARRRRFVVHAGGRT